MLTVWRIGKARYAATHFSGQGGLLAGGRWHRQGEQVAYTPESHSLAQLESLVHFRRCSRLPRLVEAYAEIPDDLPIQEINPAQLPASWKLALPYSERTVELGSNWYQAGKTAVLKVPSALARGSNYLLNPTHADYRLIKFSKPVAFRFDRRIARERK